MKSKETKRASLRTVFAALALLLISGLALFENRTTLTGTDQRLAAALSRTSPDPGARGGASPGAVTVNLDTEHVTVGRSVKNDMSPRLRDIPPVPPRHGGKEAEEHENPLLPLSGKGKRVKDPVVQKWLGPLSMPTPIANFAGVGFNGFVPPDPNGEAGPNHYVQWVNVNFEIFTKTGVPVYGPAAGSTLWTGFGGPCESTNDGDPIVLYDQIAGRWLMSQFANVQTSGPYYQCIAVSVNSDPTSSYYRYAFQTSPTVWGDYPKLGVWPDAYYMSINNFSGITYVGPSAVAFDRNAMLAGQPATFQQFNLPVAVGSLLPSDLDGNTMPPAGAPNIFASFAPTSSVTLRRFHVDWNTPANSTLSTPITVTVAPFNVSVSYLDQPGLPTSLDPLADRLMYRLAYRNFGDHESLVFNHTVNVDPNDSVAGVRWYELRALSGTPVVYQQGTFAPDYDGHWMGSMAMDHVGNIALGYSVSGDHTYPSIRYTGRLPSDPLGTLPLGETTLMAGGSVQQGSYRWGDYSMMVADPTDDCTFWYTQEYIRCCTSYADTRIGSFRFPSCTSSGTATPSSTPERTFTSTSTATPTMTRTSTSTPTSTSTSTPPTVDAFAYLQPAGPLTVTVGSKLTVDLTVSGGSSSVVGAQSYLTFTNSVLQNVDAASPGCTLATTVTADTSTFDSVLQNQVCNDNAPCSFGGVVAPPGSIAFASGALANPPASGSFRVAQVAFCASTAGAALIHWQFSPPAPRERDSQVVDIHNNIVSDAALYTDLVVNVVGTTTATATASPTGTSSPTPSPTATGIPGAVLVGHVTWQGISQPNSRNAGITGTLSLCVGGAPSGQVVSTDASGFFTVTVNAPSGTYNWQFKGRKSLATAGTLALESGTTRQEEMGTQKAGDANNSNTVTTSDFGIMRATFGKAPGQEGYDERADFNNDDLVTTTDFNLLKANFGQGGLMLTCP